MLFSVANKVLFCIWIYDFVDISYKDFRHVCKCADDTAQIARLTKFSFSNSTNVINK